MKEMLNQHGDAIAGAAGALLVLGVFAGILFGDGFSGVTRLFSGWLYG